MFRKALSLFYRGEYWGSEKWSDLSQVTKVSGRATLFNTWEAWTNLGLKKLGSLSGISLFHDASLENTKGKNKDLIKTTVLFPHT